MIQSYSKPILFALGCAILGTAAIPVSSQESRSILSATTEVSPQGVNALKVGLAELEAAIKGALPYPTENLLPQGHFGELDERGRPEGWQIFAAREGESFGLDTQGPGKPRRCLKLTGVGPHPSLLTLALTEIEVKPGRYHTVSLWLKADRPDFEVRLTLGTGIFMWHPSSRSISQLVTIGKSWQRYWLVGKTPWFDQPTQLAFLAIQPQKAGTIWIAEVEMLPTVLKGPEEAATLQASLDQAKSAFQKGNISEGYAIVQSWQVRRRLPVLVDNLETVRWAGLGPLENKEGAGFEKVFPVEAEVLAGKKPADKYPGLNGREVGWKRSITRDNRLYLRRALGHFQPWATGYLLVFAHSPKLQPVQVHLAHDDGCKFWLNGKLIHSNPLSSQATIKAQLKAGWNQLFAKVTQADDRWRWYFDCRLTDEQRGPLPGLRYSSEPETAEQ